MRAFLASGVLVAVALAGCTGSPAPSEPLQPAGEGAAQAAEGAGQAAGAAAENATAAAPAAPVATAFRFEGTTWGAACAFAVAAGQCAQVTPGDAFWPLEFPGSALRLSGNVTWTAASPRTEQLVAYLAIRDGEAWYWEEGQPATEGPSPLVLDWDLAAYAGREVALGIESFDGVGAGVAFVAHSVPQDVMVEGAVTSVPASP